METKEFLKKRGEIRIRVKKPFPVRARNGKYEGTVCFNQQELIIKAENKDFAKSFYESEGWKFEVI